MADERYTFTQARTRLEEIVAQVRKKDTTLEQSLDLLEEGVRLANVCTELSDHNEWRSVVDEQATEVEPAAETAADDETVGEPETQEGEPGTVAEEPGAPDGAGDEAAGDSEAQQEDAGTAE